LPELFGLIRRETTYAESRFDTLVPERIVWEWYHRTGGTKERPVSLAARSTFVYCTFRQFAVATQETIAEPSAPR
jgi:hypothetical protein